jgi:hypothetical protein
MNIAWIDEQVRFWYGDLYEPMSRNDWDCVRRQLSKTVFSQRIFRFPSGNDVTTEDIEKCYGTYGAYRFKTNSDVVRDMSARASGGEVVYPVLMVDAVYDVAGSITYNRSPFKRNSLLWPLAYHEKENKHGFSDNTPWDEKVQKLVYRGSCSTSISSHKTPSGGTKPSRFEIVYNNYDYEWADLGLIRPEIMKVEPVMRAMVDKVTSSNLSIEDQMKCKWVLCVEGADISSSFGWVLASNCVPLHTYPFNHEVWYFNGLEAWKHFIPVKSDGSDIPEKVQWCMENDDRCKEIALNGREHMDRMEAGVQEVKDAVADMWRMPFQGEVV